MHLSLLIRPFLDLHPVYRRLTIAIVVLAAVVASRLLGEDGRGTETPPAPVPLGSASVISSLQERIRLNSEDADAYASLGLAYLQLVRETADTSLYGRAEKALDEALALEPEHVDALVGQGLLALTRHDFQAALAYGEQARALYPYRAAAVGILVDAHVELGRYPEAVALADDMVYLRPDQASYSRVSYLRELHGDTAGAIEAMRLAAETGLASDEGTLWSQVQLGHLYFNSGNFAQAERAYRQALFFRPDYPYALAGLARLDAARGDYYDAIAIYATLVERLPLPEFVIVLGELYEVTGQTDEASRQYDLVRAIQQLNAEAGVNVDLELALFDADHGVDAGQAVERARAAYGRRPTIYAADALAWSLYRAGDYAAAWSYTREALRLGTQDALLHYHAGMIALALGDGASARRHLNAALTLNPTFSVLHAERARSALESLGPR